MSLIPRPTMNMNPNLGLGKIANIQDTELDSAAAGGDIELGAALQIADGVVTTLSDGKFYGIARAKTYIDDINVDPHHVKYVAKEMVPVLRKGTIVVAITADVTQGAPAAVDGTTGKFKPAGDTDTVVGTFKTSATFTADDTTPGSTAQLQINLP